MVKEIKSITPGRYYLMFACLKNDEWPDRLDAGQKLYKLLDPK